MVLLEVWAADPEGWQLIRYEFDYLKDPRGTGRRAHHWHALRGEEHVAHAHCEDPYAVHPHYRDVEVTILEAADEFARIHARGELRCGDLFPLYV